MKKIAWSRHRCSNNQTRQCRCSAVDSTNDHSAGRRPSNVKPAPHISATQPRPQQSRPSTGDLIARQKDESAQVTAHARIPLSHTPPTSTFITPPTPRPRTGLVFEIQRAGSTRWCSKASFPLESAGYVTRFVLNCALESIARCKLTFGDRVVLRRAGAHRLAENRGVVVTEAGLYLRRIDSCITQVKAQGPSRTCHEN